MFYASRDDGQSYILRVEDDDAAAGDLVAYLRNDSKDKICPLFGAWTALPCHAQIYVLFLLGWFLLSLFYKEENIHFNIS